MSAFKLEYDVKGVKYCSKTFSSVKSMSQYERRLKGVLLNVKRLMHHNGKYERFTVIGSKCIPLSELLLRVQELQN